MLIGVAIVLSIVLLQAATQAFGGRDRNRLYAHIGFLAIELPTLMVALTIAFNWAVRRRLAPWQTVLFIACVAGAIGLAFGIGYGAILQGVPTLHGREQRLSQSAMFGFTYAQIHSGLWTLAFVFPFAAEDTRRRAVEAERLRSAAELARLRANLEPHFLLNTLNAIAGMVTDDPRGARQLIAALGDLLRDSLKDEGELRALGREVDWLKRYADVIDARYAGRIRFRWELDPAADAVLVPAMLLQPLLENAVKHGALCTDRGGGAVTVRTELANGGKRLRCSIEDDGPGLEESPRSGGFGVHAVRRRLELRCPGSELRIESIGERGTRSIIDLDLTALESGGEL